MIKQYKKRRTGATTLFLAIILSALIFVESTYVFTVIQLDRAVLINRALKNEISTILSDYNRQLFNVYGIYAFTLDSCDNEIFYKTISEYGLEPEGYIEVNGVKAFEVEELRRSISVYYSYRAGTILVSSLATNLISALDEVDETGIWGRLGSFNSSGGGAIITKILRRADSITEILENAENFLGISDADSKISRFRSFFRRLSNLNTDEVDIDNDFDIENFGSAVSVVDSIYDFTSESADFTSEYLFHPFAINYGAYNFDSMLEGDKSINGTDFSEIHSENMHDSEYILTGMSGIGGTVIVDTLIFSTIFISSIINTLFDQETMAIISSIAEILEIVVFIASLGTIDVPYKVFEAVIVFFYALICTVTDTVKVLRGEEISLFSIDSLPDSINSLFDVGYRDFLCCFMFFVPDSILLERMNSVLLRDYGDLYVSAEVAFVSDSFESSLTDGYLLYEEV